MDAVIADRSTPSPLVALPCGSMSTTGVRRSATARHAPRLIAVVVFPTPPFWFAMAMIRDMRSWGTGVELAGCSIYPFAPPWSKLGARRRVRRTYTLRPPMVPLDPLHGYEEI